MNEIISVKNYLPYPHDYFMCFGEDGVARRIDLITSGCLPEGIDPESLVGKRVSLEYTHPYIEMAEGVVILNAAEKQNQP